MEVLDELGSYDTWRNLSGFKSDKRMRGAELILRYLALTYDVEHYEKPLAHFLNKFARDNRKAENADELKLSFKTTVDGVYKIFGKDAFRLFDEHGKADKNFNAAVFDAQMVGFARSELTGDAVTREIRTRIVKDYKELQKTPEFTRAVTASTSDPPLVRSRIRLVTALFNSFTV